MPEDRRSEHAARAQRGAPHPDQAITRLASEQHGVVARTQLLETGVTRRMIAHRLATSQLIALHRGVYAVGHARLRREGWWLAAVLAVGPEAVLSHRDAAALHDLRPSGATRIEASTPTKRRPAGIHVHGRRLLEAQDVTTVEGIPVTTVARTLVDLAEVLAKDHLAKVLGEAERQSKLDARSIEGVLQRTRGRRGTGHAKIRTALRDLAAHGATLTRSALEDAFLGLVDDTGLPRPAMNAHIEGHEVDALWRPQRVAVELDGYAFHHGKRAFERDRAKANALTLAGYTVLRFTHAQVTRTPGSVAAQLTRALGSAPPPRAAARPA